MLDQRGGAFTLGLGLVRGMAVIPEAETWSEERLQRTLSLADTTVVELPTGSAVVGHDGAWELTGSPAPTVHGELSAVTSQ
jgi:cyanophycinase